MSEHKLGCCDGARRFYVNRTKKLAVIEEDHNLACDHMIQKAIEAGVGTEEQIRASLERIK